MHSIFNTYFSSFGDTLSSRNKLTELITNQEYLTRCMFFVAQNRIKSNDWLKILLTINRNAVKALWWCCYQFYIVFVLKYIYFVSENRVYLQYYTLFVSSGLLIKNKHIFNFGLFSFLTVLTVKAQSAFTA